MNSRWKRCRFRLGYNINEPLHHETYYVIDTVINVKRVRRSYGLLTLLNIDPRLMQLLIWESVLVSVSVQY